MASPGVDIIVPTYNRRAVLPAALESVAQQSHANWVCWIVEDGKTEETEECVKSYCRDPRFVYLPGEHFGFPAGPRNRAIKAGKAEYIALLDDDDCWFPQKLAEQVSFMESHPECAMVGVNGYRWSGGERQAGEEGVLYHTKIRGGRISMKTLLQGNCFIASGVLIRRGCLERSGPFNIELTPPIGEDYELWIRLAATGALWFLNTPLIYFRENAADSYYAAKLPKSAHYQLKATLLWHALQGCNGCSPLSQAKDLYQQVENKRKRLLAGPGAVGLLRYLAGKLWS